MGSGPPARHAQPLVAWLVGVLVLGLGAAIAPSATGRPVVTGMSAAAGPSTGGVRLTLSGRDFVRGATVRFGTVPGRSVRVHSPTRLTVTTPRHASGLVPVYVQTPRGRSAAVTRARYRFVPRPTISAVTPNRALTAGGTIVTITGSGFDASARTRFGSPAGTTLRVESSRAMEVRAPAHPAGVVVVTVTTEGGTSAPVAAARVAYHAPLAISELRVRASTETTQSLSWIDPTGPDLAGVTVRRANGAAAPTTPTAGSAVPVSSPRATSVLVNGLTEGRTYSYSVFARDRNGQYAARATVTAATTACLPAATVPSTITSDTTLSPQCQRSYVLSGPVSVPAGVTLTLEAGAVVRAGTDGGLDVRGSLVADGTPGEPVVFTSVNDVPGSGIDPAGGDWAGIQVEASGTVTLAGTTLRYARTALAVDDGAEVVVRGRILDSTVGVDSPDAVVDARYVDWGDPSGPAPVGSGTPVSGAGVFATPWIGFTPPTRPGAQPPTRVPPADTTCADLLFIGARGSGEGPQGSAVTDPSTTDRDLLGSRTVAILDRLTSDLAAGPDPLTVRTLGLRYPAAPPPYAAFSDVTTGYLASIYAGVDELESDLATEHARCPGERIVLAGYSQGALVVHLALTELGGQSALAQYPIAAVELVADPARDSTDADQRYGAADLHAAGIWSVGIGPTPLPDRLVGLTAEICHLDDAVCDATRPATSGGYRLNPDARGAPHASYPVGDELDQLADYASTLLRAPPG